MLVLSLLLLGLVLLGLSGCGGSSGSGCEDEEEFCPIPESASNSGWIAGSPAASSRAVAPRPSSSGQITVAA